MLQNGIITFVFQTCVFQTKESRLIVADADIDHTNTIKERLIWRSPDRSPIKIKHETSNILFTFFMIPKTLENLFLQFRNFRTNRARIDVIRLTITLIVHRHQNHRKLHRVHLQHRSTLLLIGCWYFGSLPMSLNLALKIQIEGDSGFSKPSKVIKSWVWGHSSWATKFSDFHNVIKTLNN